MTKQKKRRLEAIRWADHCALSDSGWKSPEDVNAMEPTTIVSVGFVAKEAPDHIVLIATVTDSGHSMTGEICIVKSAIVKRWRLPDPTGK